MEFKCIYCEFNEVKKNNDVLWERIVVKDCKVEEVFSWYVVEIVEIEW